MKHIVILTTGGTIAMRYDETAGGAVPALGGADFRAALADLPLAITVEEICNLPSAHFTLDTLWAIRQCAAAHAARPDIDGIVITHGTDVLEETAMLLDLTVEGDKPLVLTGAMRTASEPGYDGFANLAAAVRVAASDAARGLGALVVFNDTVHAARYVTKTHTQALDTFRSPGWGPLGRLDADGLHIAWRVARRTIPCSRLERRVELIKLAVGMEPDALRQAVARGLRGVVLEALGGGRVPPWWLPVIGQAVEGGVTVVIASRCPAGRVGDRYGYAGAQRDLRAMGCLPAGVLNGLKARIGLMVLLGAGLEGDALRAAWAQIAGASE
ncbi:MAG: asparaginase [Anaerolineae bacterium]|nr:asparaginase [Anaerolineae bacterium]